MATIDATFGTASNGFAWGNSRIAVVQRTLKVDATAYKGPTGVSNAGYYVNALEAGDIVQVIDVPAGSYLLDIQLEIVTAGTGVIEVGDEDDDDRFLASGDLTTTGVATMTARSRLFTDDDAIAIKFESANDGATASQLPEVVVTAVFIDLNNKTPAATFTP
jgi:hypothetical protein